MAKETVFRTPVTPTEYLPMTGNTMETDPGWFSPQLMMGTRDLQVFNMYGEAKYTGTISGALFPSNGIQLLVAAIGTDTVTGTVAPYTHTLAQANVLESLTVEKNIGDFQSLQFAGTRVGKFSLKCAAGNNPATIDVDCTASLAAVLDSPSAISVIDEIPFVFAEGTVTIFGDVRAEVSNVQIDIDNGLKETYTFDKEHGPSFITPVTLHCSGQVDLVWDSLDDSTYGDYTKMVDGTLGVLDVLLEHPTAADGSVEMTLAQIAYSKYSNDLKISDVVMTTLNFEGSKDLTAGHTVAAVVKNSQSTAY